MALAVPIDSGSITAEWLSDALGAAVGDFSMAFLEGGVLSDVYRIHDIRYLGPASAGPTSVVVKIATESDERRQAAISCNAYAKELNFFRQLAPQTPIRSPIIYTCTDDGAEMPERFAIVMEDLSTHSKVFDQVADPPDERFAHKLALDAAALHAHFWESEATRLPWLGGGDGRYAFSLEAMSRAAPDAFGEFTRLWRKIFDEDLFDEARSADAARLVGLLTGPASAAIHDRIFDLLSSRPKTLLHGDMRADNLFRTDPALGRSPEDSQLTFIDWQVTHVGPPGPEFTQAWMHSLEPEVRRNDLRLLRAYRERLVELNPAAAAYSYDMLVEDYSLSHCFWLTALLTLGVDTLPMFDQPEGQRMRQLWYKGLTRTRTAITDLDCLGRVERLLAG